MNCQQCGKIHSRCHGHKSADPNTPCHRFPIKGGTVCKSHGGSAPQVAARAAVRAEVLAWGLGSAHVDPGEILLRLVTQSAARVEFLADLLRQAYEAADRLQVAHEAEKLIVADLEPGWDDARDKPIPPPAAAQAAAEDLRRIFNTGGVSALIGNTYAATSSGSVYASGEAIRGLAKLEAEERDRCAGFAAKAVAAGLAKQQIEAAKETGRKLIESMLTMARLLGHDPTSPEVLSAVRQAIAEHAGLGDRVIPGELAALPIG